MAATAGQHHRPSSPIIGERQLLADLALALLQPAPLQRGMAPGPRLRHTDQQRHHQPPRARGGLPSNGFPASLGELLVS